jgi:hypothetical protein
MMKPKKRPGTNKGAIEPLINEPCVGLDLFLDLVTLIFSGFVDVESSL